MFFLKMLSKGDHSPAFNYRSRCFWPNLIWIFQILHYLILKKLWQKWHKKCWNESSDLKIFGCCMKKIFNELKSIRWKAKLILLLKKILQSLYRQNKNHNSYIFLFKREQFRFHFQNASSKVRVAQERICEVLLLAEADFQS